MNLFALLLGLGLERVLTHLFHLREFRWLDPLFDTIFARIRRLPMVAGVTLLLLLAFLLVLPVLALSIVLDDALLHIPAFAFAVVILLFSLGPRDLKEEVDDYCAAADAGDAEGVRRVAKELLEADPPDDVSERERRVERAVFGQANNRIFGVVFWFLLLGPTGAWLFRVLDLMRHHLAFHTAADDDPDEARLVAVVRGVHGALAWIPARLLAISYALAGSFEEAINDWRGYYQNCAPRFFDVSNDVLACAGSGATGRAGDQCEISPGARVRAAMDLIIRTLWLIWCPVIAVLTLYDLVT